MAEPESELSDATESVRNVLFIMCDQLRWDALSCSGAEFTADTPNIDRLAARGVRFDKAFIQGAVCGSSRMSFYTGRYVYSHGARWNNVPLQVNQRTLGDHLKPQGVRSVLIGKTHMVGDKAGLGRLGLEPGQPEWIFASECGFEADLRDDGLHPDEMSSPQLPYNQFLRSHGYRGPNPWHSAANSVRDQNDQWTSGWLLRAAKHPAIVPDELSETAFLTDRAIDFIRDAGDDRWCVHLSYIKPHWPYVASAPYHSMYGAGDVPRPNRADHELDTDHPVLAAFRNSRVGRAFHRPETRSEVYPTYYGMVKQIDDHLGRLFAELEQMGRLDDTLIVLTSDHGDYLGDHWMGEKDWLNEEIVRIPMIVVDPRPAADMTRGTSSQALVEAIDLVPTFIDAVGGDLPAAQQWIEGESLVPLLSGTGGVTRTGAVCEADYGYLEMSRHLPRPVSVAEHRATMFRTDRYKYVLSETGPDLLYDLDEDPGELHDRLDDPALASVSSDLREQLFEWYRHRRLDTTAAEPFKVAMSTPGRTAQRGIVIGYWDEDELAAGKRGELY